MMSILKKIFIFIVILMVLEGCALTPGLSSETDTTITTSTTTSSTTTTTTTTTEAILVTYMLYDDEYRVVSVPIGSRLEEPAPPTREGYTFIG